MDCFFFNSIFYISILVVYLTNMKQINSVQEENRNSVRPLLGLKIAPYGLGNSHYDGTNKPHDIMVFSYSIEGKPFTTDINMISEYRDFFKKKNNEFLSIRLFSEKKIIDVDVKFIIIFEKKEYKINKVFPYIDSDELIYFHIPEYFRQVLKDENSDFSCQLQVTGTTIKNESFLQLFEGSKATDYLVDDVSFAKVKEEYGESVSDMFPTIKHETLNLSIDFSKAEFFFNKAKNYIDFVIKSLVFCRALSDKEFINIYNQTELDSILEILKIDYSPLNGFSKFKASFFHDEKEIAEYNNSLSDFKESSLSIKSNRNDEKIRDFISSESKLQESFEKNS
ncbi:hypothetical protein OENI_10069 [Oenococcus oeni]|nr:hypothetical protein OENI_10069 [Oenococcus oeni]